MYNKEVNDLMASTVLLGHIWEGLLLLGVVIVLLTLVLHLLTFLFLLYVSTGASIKGGTVLYMWFGNNLLYCEDISWCTLRPYRKSGLPLLLSLCPDSLLLCSLSTTLLLKAHKQKHTQSWWFFFFFFNQTEAQVFLFDGRAHNSVNEGDELLFLFLPLDEMSLD